MIDPRDMPRVYINWDRARPTTLSGWLAAIAVVAIGIAVFALVAVVASTLFIVAVVVGMISAVTWYISNLFRRRRPGREIGPYKGNYDA